LLYLAQTYLYVKLRYAYFILFSFQQVFSFNKVDRSNLEKTVTIVPGLPYNMYKYTQKEWKQIPPFFKCPYYL